GVLVVAAGCGASPDGMSGMDEPDLAIPAGPTSPDLGVRDGGRDDDGGSQGGGDDDGGVAAPNRAATISGVINGYQITNVRSVVAVVTGQSFEVYISDRADLCTIMQMGSSPKDTSIFRLGSSAGMGPHTFPAGTYTYPSGPGSGSGGGNGGGGMGGGGTG